MKKGFVLLREFIYGLDFTEFGDDEEIIVHETAVEAYEEMLDEYEGNIDMVRDGEKDFDDVCFDLVVARCKYDDEKIIAYQDDKIILEQTK